jgi:hypothetical protein
VFIIPSDMIHAYCFRCTNIFLIIHLVAGCVQPQFFYTSVYKINFGGTNVYELTQLFSYPCCISRRPHLTMSPMGKWCYHVSSSAVSIISLCKQLLIWLYFPRSAHAFKRLLRPSSVQRAPKRTRWRFSGTRRTRYNCKIVLETLGWYLFIH